MDSIRKSIKREVYHLMWWLLIIFVVALVAAFIFAPSIPPQPAPAVGEVEVSSSEEGKTLSVVYGTKLIRDLNVVWYGDVSTTPITRSGGGGKK